MPDQKKLRIACVTNNYTPYSGGVVSSINAFAGQLRARGHELQVVTLDFLGDGHNDPSYVKRIPSIVRFSRGKNRLAVPWRPDAHVLDVLDAFKPDIVHTQHPFLLGYSALQAARELGVPIVFTYHTIYERYTHYIPLPRVLIQPIVTKKVLRFCADVDRIIAPSCAIRDYLARTGVTTPVSVVPSPVREEFLAHPECFSKPTANTGVSKDPFNLILVTRFVQEKSIPFLLDVVAQLDPNKFHLTLVGYGPEEENLRSYAYTTLGLSPQFVAFVKKPPLEKLLRLYREADLFLFPSTSDTQGLVLAEAMGGGTPVVVVDGPGQRDIVKQGKNGFLVDSAQQMIERIYQIAADPALQEMLVQGALETAAAYHPVALTDRLVQVYRGLL